MKIWLGLILTFSAAMAGPLYAQLVPNDRWYTIETPHFRVHFTSALESEGKRAAVNAERAFAELSTELKPPGGKVDLVVADNFDYVNGYATPFPGNRIVIFAHPPVDANELRNYDDWSRLVITHELTHIFHLDRADGIWRAGRAVFGRHPAFFPNAFQPAWLTEGLAVYYESRVTGAGRLEGSEHYMLARAAAEAGRVPRIGELSRATTRYPGGETVYAYGGLLLDYLARTRGTDKIGKFVDKTSRVILPLSLNARAKSVFGISFENAWRDWRDSLVTVSVHADPIANWREITKDGRLVEFPQWRSDTTLLYTASTGKVVTSLYEASLSGRVTRIGRRNARDANVPLANGSIVFAQPDYTDAFHYRNDLWVERDGEVKRLTRGARIGQPDARSDGEIVAVQLVAGSTRLVRVSADGRSIRPITEGTELTQWAEPRWSPDGSRIAAVKIERGGWGSIVILDADGVTRGVVVSERAVVATPSWAPGNRILFSSNISGTTQAYSVSASGSSASQTPLRLTASSTGFFHPVVSPDGKLLAGVSFRYDGYHLGVGPAVSSTVRMLPAQLGPRDGCTTCRLATNVAAPMAVEGLAAARRYSPWRSLLPTYWEPILTQSTGEGSAYGAATSGEDVVGRHSYYAQGSYSTTRRETEAFAAYQYAGFGQPYLNFTAEQNWERFGLFNNAGRVGDLDRRTRIGGASLAFVRPRARTFSSLSVGAELESREYYADPDTLLRLLPPSFATKRNYPSLYSSAGWTNAKRPPLSISREDGIALSTTVRQRWQGGDAGGASRSIVGVTSAYKSLDLPGFAHHVIAVRAAGGYADERAISTFSVGGLSGGSIDVISGVPVGGERRTFGVRGFSPSTEQGIRALGGSIEYRAPLAAPSRRVPFIPLLFDRISISTFGEAGRAFCPASVGVTSACRISAASYPWLASAGGEIDFDTALQYDVPARFRLGIAAPVLNRKFAGADPVSVYLTFGSAF